MLYQSCRLLVIKALVASLGAFSGAQVAFAQAAVVNEYRLNPVQGCFIKAIQNRSYVDVALEKFSEVKIHAVAHPSRPKYFAFKSLGVIHLVPQKCLTPWSSLAELDDLPEIPETDEFKKYERPTKRSREDRILNKIEVNQMNYFIEVAGGVGFVSDGKGSLDSKTTDSAERFYQDIFGVTAKLKNSESKVSGNPSSFSVKFGFRSSDNSFWSFGFKSFNLSRKDEYVFDLNSGASEETLALNVEDNIRQVLIGHIWFIDTKSSIRPFFDLSLFISLIQQTMRDDLFYYNFSGTGVGGAVGGGLEFLISRNLSLRFSGNYSHNFLSRFKFKKTDDPILEVFDYTGQFQYSHLSANLGLTLYFQ